MSEIERKSLREGVFEAASDLNRHPNRSMIALAIADPDGLEAMIGGPFLVRVVYEHLPLCTDCSQIGEEVKRSRIEFEI